MTALIAFGYGFGIRRISALPDAQTTQARSQPHPTRTRTPPCDGPNVSKRDDIIPIGLATTSRFTLARRFPDVEPPKLRGAWEEPDQEKEVGGVICVRQRDKRASSVPAMASTCHAMPSLPYCSTKRFSSFPVVSAQARSSSPHVFSPEDPLPHFPFWMFPRALCRPGSSS